MPKGPAGQFAWFLAFTHGIPTYVKGKDSDASKEFLKYIYDPKQYDAWFEQNKGYSVGPGDRLESSKMWETLPKPLAPFQLPDLIHVRDAFAEPIGAPETLAR